MNEGKLNQSQRITLVTNNTKLFDGAGPEELSNEQIGVFTQDGRARFKGTVSPVAAKKRKFKIIQGFPYKFDKGLKRAQLPSWNHETVEFKADEITRWEGVSAKPFTQEEIVAIGYDGVDITKGLKVVKGQDVKVHVHLTGGPIHKMSGTTGYIHQELFIDSGCIADAEPGSFRAEQLVMRQIVDTWNKRNFGNLPMSRFAKATGISTCAQNGTPLVAYKSFQTTVVDDGTDLATGLVQRQYPGKGVKRVGRANLISTYEITQIGTAANPTALSLATFPVLPKCAVCPAGYTLRTAGAVFEVTVPSEAVMADQAGQLSKTKLANDVEQDVYQFVMPAGTQTDAFTTGITATVPDAEVVFVGSQESLCIPPAAGTVAWTQTGTANKASKVYTITLADDVCGNDRLVELQGVYGTGVTVDVDGACSKRYKLTVLSDTVIDDLCGEELYTWQKPSAYSGTSWEEAPVAEEPTGCHCGVKFEGARFVRPVTAETYPYVGYDSKDFDPVHIKISSFAQAYNGPVCQNPFPFTHLQSADYPVGYGRDVIQHELDSLHYFGKGPYNFHPVVREIYGSKFLAKPDQYYDSYMLEIVKHHKDGAYFGSSDFAILYRFYFPAGQGKEFEAAINSLIVSADNDLTEVSL